MRIIIADDNEVALEKVLKKLHLPDHTVMKAIYVNSKHIYDGFKI